MLAAADPSDGVEDVLMFHPAGLEAADPACELELRSMTLKKQFIEEKKDHQIQK